MKRHIKPETQAVLITPPASGMQNDDDWKTPCGFSDDSYQKNDGRRNPTPRQEPEGKRRHVIPHAPTAHAVRKIEKPQRGKRQNITCVKSRSEENVKTKHL